MTIEIDVSTIEGLAEKLRTLDLSQAEGVLLKSILNRATEVDAEVEGFGWQGAELTNSRAAAFDRLLDLAELPVVRGAGQPQVIWLEIPDKT